MIWVREVNSAILKHIRTLMEDLQDHYGNSVNPRVIMRKPDTDITQEQYPVITVSSLQYTQDILHSDVNSLKIQNSNDSVLKGYNSPNWRFSYQIDIWTETPIQLDSITTAWIKSHPTKYSVIEVTDSNGSDTQLCRFTNRNFRNIDFVDSKGINIYRNVINCDILVAIGVDSLKHYSKVLNVSINKK